MNKAASTAKTFGITLDELLGHTTAIGAATRESGNIVGNSLKSIYARITTNSSAVTALDAIGISMENLDGSSKNASELIQEIAGRWDGLSDAQRRNTAVGVAGIYQLSRFNALMLNYQMGVDATTASLNSYGSAMKEQEKYEQSLEARLNRMQTAWYGFADALGSTVLYDTLVVGTEFLTNLTKASDSASGSTLGLSLAMGALIAPITLLSGRFTAFTTGVIQNTASQIANRGASIATARAYVAQQVATVQASIATRGFTGSLVALTASATAAGVAIRSALMMTGIGIAIAGVTALITVLTSKMSENIQKQEEFDTYMKKNTEALTVHKEQVEELLTIYNNMSKDNKDTWNVEQQEKFIATQNQLAELYPSLIAYVDSNGNAHLKTSEAIEKEIEKTNTLINAERALQREQAKRKFDDGLGDIDDTKSQIETLKKTRDSKINNLTPEEVAKLNLTISKLEAEIYNKSAEIRGSVMDIADAFTDAGTDIESVVNNHISKAIGNVDFTGLNSSQLESFSKNIADVRKNMSQAFKDGDQEALIRYNLQLIRLMDGTGSLVPETDRVSVSVNDLAKAMELNAEFTGMSADEMDEMQTSADKLSGRISELQGNLTDYKDVTEELAGVSSASLDDSEELLFLYRQLDNQLTGYTDKQIADIQAKTSWSAEEKRVIDLAKQRSETIEMLNVLYPKYAILQEGQISLSAEQVEAMKREEHANRILLESYELARDGKYSAEQEKTLAQAQGTKARIDEIRKEIEALEILIQQYEDTANAKLTTQEFIDKVTNGELQSEKYSFFIPGITEQEMKDELSQKKLDLSQYTNSLESNLNALDSWNSSLSSSSKSSKKSNETTRQSIYVTDEFKNALEALNLEVVKQQKLRAKEPEWSEKYRKSLQEQIKLEKQKLELQKQQAKELEKQIASGKIRETGLITKDGGSSKSSGSTKTTSFSGWGGSITSQYGMRMHPTLGYEKMHSGIDIAGKLGTNLSSNVSGKVIGAGKNDVSGNFVKIQDSNGYQHFYGHLEKAFVKIGDLIEQGMSIGTIGSTGRSTGSHLHYEVKNSGGQYMNPIDFVNQAKSMSGTTTSSSSSTSSGKNGAEMAQAMDGAKSELLAMKEGILNQQEVLEDLENQIMQSYFAKFDRRRDEIDRQMSYEEAKIKNLNNTSERYAKTQQYQITLMERKQQANKEELSYLNDLVKKGGLSSIALANVTDRTKELMTSMESLNSEMARFKLDVIYDKYDTIMKANDFSIEKLNAGIEQIDKNSAKYADSLNKIVVAQKNKYNANQQEINDLKKLINSGKVQGEMLEEATDKVHELTIAMQQLNVQMSDTNYEIIVNIKTRYAEEIDDLSDEIERSKSIQSLYQEGSADATNEMRKQVQWYERMAEAYDESRRKLQQELNTRDLLPERIKEITELLEDETKAYWSTMSAISSLNKQIEETDKRLREEIANNLINAYKNYVQERQEEHMKMLDDEEARETELHNKRMKELSDEMDLFRKNVEERLRLIDRAEAERDYNMEIDEMESERNKLVDQINLLSMDNSYEARSKRKKLLEQLDKLDKDIAERRHDRDIELQKQGLNDLLELKEDELAEKEEILDEEHQTLLNSLSAQRKYWEKYYNDLLNDERKFAQIREDIMNGHFEKVADEFQGYIQEMINTMPLLSDTMNGTMEGVGTAIRQNVIDELNNAIQKMKEFQDMQIATNKYVDDFDPNSSKDTSYSGNTGSKPSTSTGSNNSGNTNNNNKPSNSYSNLNNADLKVLLGKFIRENIAPQAPQGSERDSVKYKGDTIAAEGRAEGSQISPNETLSQALGKLDKGAMTALSNFTTYSFGGITSEKYKNMILKWSNQLRSKAASLNGGGLLNFSGSGIDGIGGKAIIAHDGEVIQTPVEVDKLLKTTSMIDNIARMLAPVMTNVPALEAVTNGTGGDSYEINFNGTIQNSNGRTGQTLAQDIINGLKTKKGV